jgi:hypothetical protein
MKSFAAHFFKKIIFRAKFRQNQQNVLDLALLFNFLAVFENIVKLLLE